MTTLTRRATLGAALALPLARPAIAAGAVEWRMVTSWPRNLPGPGVTAQRLADRIAAMSGGRLTVKLFAAGELTPALEVFDAVSAGTADAAHTASFYWQGRIPAAAFYTTVPFGLTPDEHRAWLTEGGGQGLWDEVYAPFGLKPFVGGNTGPSMGGWFKRRPEGLDTFRGLKIRVQGLGGEVFRRLGATPVSTPAGEILPALQSGVIDAVEFLGPSSDLALGLYRPAKFYVYPGFNKPNGGSEFLVSLKAWEALPDDLKAIVEHATAAEEARALAEIRRQNEGALAALTGEHGVTLAALPADVLAAARGHAADVLDELGAGDAAAARVLESYRGALERGARWSRVSVEAFLAAREG